MLSYRKRTTGRSSSTRTSGRSLVILRGAARFVWPSRADGMPKAKKQEPVSEVLGGSYAEVPLDMIKPNPWNPNEMRDDAFDALVQEISDTGMITVLQVTPHIDDKGNSCFRLIGGEHRHKALKLLGYQKAPCVVLEGDKWTDEDRQKFETVRLNIIHGENNPEKFMALYMDVAERHHGADLQKEVGFTDDDAWEALVGQVVSDADSGQLPHEAKEKIKKEIHKLAGPNKTIDQLASIIDKIMQEYGDTVDHRFIYFDMGGKKHLHVDVSSKTFAKLEVFMNKVKHSDLDADQAFSALLDKAAELLGI